MGPGKITKVIQAIGPCLAHSEKMTSFPAIVIGRLGHVALAASFPDGVPTSDLCFYSGVQTVFSFCSPKKFVNYYLF